MSATRLPPASRLRFADASRHGVVRTVLPPGTEDASGPAHDPGQRYPELVHLSGFRHRLVLSRYQFGMSVFWVVLGTASAAMGRLSLTILMSWIGDLETLKDIQLTPNIRFGDRT